MKRTLPLILSVGILVGCATAPEAVKEVEARISKAEYELHYGSEEIQNESIIFNWDTLSEEENHLAAKLGRRFVESLILEASSEYKTDKYVEISFDFLNSDHTINIHFKHAFDGMHTSYGNEHTITLNPNILSNEGKLLSTTFHEFSHAYDDIMGLTPNARKLHTKEKQIRDEYDNYKEGCDAIWAFYETEEYKELSPIVREEVRESEIRAYTRQLEYIEMLKDRNWDYGVSFEEHREKLLNNMKKYINRE